jgi:hypothetical protein
VQRQIFNNGNGHCKGYKPVTVSIPKDSVITSFRNDTITFVKEIVQGRTKVIVEKHLQLPISKPNAIQPLKQLQKLLRYKKKRQTLSKSSLAKGCICVTYFNIYSFNLLLFEKVTVLLISTNQKYLYLLK